MKLAEFDRRLRKMVGPADGWPFLCEGSPLDSDVFLVGMNPRSDTPFWPHWTERHGFDKGGWLADYIRRERKVGRTRGQLELLVGTLHPLKCLETNVYAVRSPRLADLPLEARNTAVFDFLLAAIRPRLVFVHGRQARLHVEQLIDAVLPMNEFVTVESAHGPLEVLAANHLSYQLSRAACRRIGERISAHLSSVV